MNSHTIQEYYDFINKQFSRYLEIMKEIEEEDGFDPQKMLLKSVMTPLSMILTKKKRSEILEAFEKSLGVVREVMEVVDRLSQDEKITEGIYLYWCELIKEIFETITIIKQDYIDVVVA